MKKYFLALMLTFSAFPAITDATPQPNFLDGIHGCVEMSVAYARFATMAEVSQDKDKAAFMDFIQEIVDSNPNPKTKKIILVIGQLAWASRGHGSIQAESMHIYDMCYSKLGIHT